ncbi:Vacuolar ATPase assembly integral membrane protein VMA21 homolog [Gryllus bimaculatus]|nr:Vacuolar ATPase assembly integral membrane protein VMA21 homolog [Gryllus bimaculatus]
MEIHLSRRGWAWPGPPRTWVEWRGGGEGVEERADSEVLRKTVLKSCCIYCLAIFLSPVLTFFGTKELIFKGFLELDDVLTNVYSAVASVIALHVVFGMFIYKAYSYPAPPQKPRKDD